jgi:site-specific DNA-cytosine methylase
MSVTFTDMFCGSGASSLGLAAAGFELRLAANHQWLGQVLAAVPGSAR